jgi:hypothetical protein
MSKFFGVGKEKKVFLVLTGENELKNKFMSNEGSS